MVNLVQHPELVAMLEENKDISKFLNVSPEDNLLRWLNFHLKRANHHRRVHNFGSDIQDAENYLVLLQQIAPHLVPRGVYLEPDPQKRAEYVCYYADQLGCPRFVTPKDILEGNEKLNLAFTAYLFNRYPGLEVLDDNVLQQKALQDAEALMKHKFEEEDKQRALRWQYEEEERRKKWEEEENKKSYSGKPRNRTEERGRIWKQLT